MKQDWPVSVILKSGFHGVPLHYFPYCVSLNTTVVKSKQKILSEPRFFHLENDTLSLLVIYFIYSSVYMLNPNS